MYGLMNKIYRNAHCTKVSEVVARFYQYYALVITLLIQCGF